MKSQRSYAISEIKEKLAPLFKEEGLQMVLLFGSQGSGRVHPESDIDLGFLYDEPVDLIDLTNKVTLLLHTDRVDVIDLRRANPLLCFSAAGQGKLLYERLPGQFNIFYSLSFRRYIDTKKLRDARKRVIQHFLKEKGLG
ncbi:MAG: nucleotidyltransferase domain-containing protein [Proteobacteria bacterium]|nr:nucleotidyltransferase domain-containing protein [Pseudomonadota bacterium]